MTPLRSKTKQDALDLADIASSGMPLAADPEMLEAALRSLKGTGPSQDAQDLADIASSGMPMAADPEMLDAGLKDARGYAKGGVVQDQEPTEIPADIREYIEAIHKERGEARPDEGWRIRPADKPESEVPYKRNEDAEPSVLDHLRGMTGMAEGGVVPTVQPPDDDPEAWAKTIGVMGEGPGANQPVAAPVSPAPAPIVPQGTSPAPNDQVFMDKANQILGLNPQEQAGFMKMLGQNQQKAQVGAGIAGIGDAIASGGTLGKVNPGALNKSEDIAQNATREGIEGMQTIRSSQEKAHELSDKLEERDPNSPLSKWAQKAYAGVGKKIGLDLSHASATLIADVSGKGVDALKADYEQQLKTMGLDLQKKQIEATIGNQKAERDIAREGHKDDAAKSLLAGRGIIQSIAAAIPGTASNTATKVLRKEAEGSPEPLNFATEEEAKLAKLPPGTAITIGNRRARVK